MKDIEVCYQSPSQGSSLTVSSAGGVIYGHSLATGDTLQLVWLSVSPQLNDQRLTDGGIHCDRTSLFFAIGGPTKDRTVCHIAVTAKTITQRNLHCLA